MEQKQRIIKIINEEITILQKGLEAYIQKKKYKDAKILAKTLIRLRKMIIRIQEET